MYLFYIDLNVISLSFYMLVRQNKEFDDVILGCKKL